MRIKIRCTQNFLEISVNQRKYRITSVWPSLSQFIDYKSNNLALFSAVQHGRNDIKKFNQIQSHQCFVVFRPFFVRVFVWVRSDFFYYSCDFRINFFSLGKCQYSRVFVKNLHFWVQLKVKLSTKMYRFKNTISPFQANYWWICNDQSEIFIHFISPFKLMCIVYFRIPFID